MSTRLVYSCNSASQASTLNQIWWHWKDVIAQISYQPNLASLTFQCCLWGLSLAPNTFSVSQEPLLHLFRKSVDAGEPCVSCKRICKRVLVSLGVLVLLKLQIAIIEMSNKVRRFLNSITRVICFQDCSNTDTDTLDDNNLGNWRWLSSNCVPPFNGCRLRLALSQLSSRWARVRPSSA